jgi:DNA (cytosine-5)-methyltransferase 1
MITIGSLFSGIGGLELGIESAFAAAGVPARVAWQVEQDEYCRAVLAKHWPGADRSVVDVRAAGLSLPRVDVLCGGPPCQDISGAGKQEGLSGERSGLLFEYLRIVRELRPTVCVVENVYGGEWRAWVDAIRCGLEGAGYRVRAGRLRASDVGAPHRRARVFVVAYANGAELREQPRGIGWARGAGEAFARGCGEAVADADRGRAAQPQGSERGERGWSVDGGESDVGHADRSRLEERSGEPGDARQERSATLGAGDPIERSGRSECGLGRDVDGLPPGLDAHRWPAGRGEAQGDHEPPRTVAGKQPNRRPRLKALGNAVVPQCSEAVGRELVVPFFLGGEL